MADLIAKLKLDSKEFETNIGSAVGSLKRLGDEAELTKKGFNGMFTGADLQQAMTQFPQVGNIITSLKTKMSQSGMGMKQELKAITGAASELTQAYRNLSTEERNSAAGTALKQHIDELIQKGGQLKDTIGDTKAAITAASSDTMAFSALTQGLNVVVSGFGIATGAASAFGISEKQLVEIQTTLQSVLVVSNGLTQIQNALQEQSALRMGISAVKTTILSTATAIKTGVTNADTIASKAAAVAQAIWNNAIKANPIMALITVISAVVLCIYEYCRATKEQTQAQRELNAEKQRAYEMENEYKNKVAESVGKQIAEYNRLRTAWISLGNDMDAKKKFIDNNKSAFESLGLSINGVGDAENQLVKNTSNVVKAIEDRAKAIAAQDSITENYQNYFKKRVSNEQQFGKVAVTKAGTWVSSDDIKKYGLGSNDLTGVYTQSGGVQVNGAGAAKITNYNMVNAAKQWKEANRAAEQNLAKSNQPYLDIIAQTASSTAKIVNNTVSNQGKTSKGSTEASEALKTGTEWYDQKISEQQIILQTTIDPVAYQKAEDEIQALTASKHYIELYLSGDIKELGNGGFGQSKTVKSLDDINKGMHEFNDSLNNKSDKKVSKIGDSINDITGKVSQVTGLANSFKSLGSILRSDASDFDKITQSIDALCQIASGIGGIIDLVNTLSNTSHIASTQAVTDDITETAASETKASADTHAAAAGFFKAHSWIPFVGVGLAVAAIATMLATMAFENGGIVGGNSYTGDKLFARINSGEMILNRTQQQNLAGMLDNNGAIVGGTVELKVRGKDLVGAIKNYNSIKSTVK